jgi:threonine-phosphate decarboxylase
MEHGGDVYSNGLLQGRKLLDYSSNINPLPLSTLFLYHIGEGLNKICLYPDVKYRDLKDDLLLYLKNSEQYFSVEDSDTLYLNSISRNNILVGNGASEVLDLIISSLKSITITVPSFVEYEAFSEKHKLEIHYSGLNKDMEYDYSDILLKLKDTEGLILGNPNNPNGCIINSKEFVKILDFCEDNNKLVIIDEAFIEFVLAYEQSFIRYIDKYSCLVIIRAITKFYGMPGIRFGYGITRNNKILNFLEKNQNPWSVNCFAEVAVKYALVDEEYINKSKIWIREERNFLIKELENIKYIEKAYQSHGNYFLCKLKYINSNNFYDFMLQEGILIRNCSNYRGLDNSYVRVAIKDREANMVFIEKLKLLEKNLVMESHYDE